MNSTDSIRLHHNLDASRFMWLWAKYVQGFRDQYHCTNCLKGPYSKKLNGTKHPDLIEKSELVMDEEQEFKALYICGVAKKLYSVKKNYPHNLHIAIKPLPGNMDSFSFEDWEIKIGNGLVLEIPEERMLPSKYRGFPPEYTTCRIFRWGACSPLLKADK